MNRKIEKVREDIHKAEARAREAEEYVKTLRAIYENERFILYVK